jgi:AcrR family transcriptional regulator
MSEATEAQIPDTPHSSAEARNRDTILREAARLVTVEGIEGLSIARLAAAVGLSKSGLFAHFRSKEELQLATIETADEIFRTEVIRPALEASPGIARLRALCEAFLAHLERGVFPGGCFFASVAAEVDTHPGPVRDRALATVAEWFGQLETAAREAQAEGTVKPEEDPTQIAFELDALVLLANAQYVASGDVSALDRARHGIKRLLDSVAPTE